MTSTELRPTRSLAALVGIALTLVAAWLLVGFFNASEFYRRAAARGGPAPWNYTLIYHITVGLTWAYFTPLIVAYAERLSLQRNRVRNLLILVVSVPLVAAIRAAWGGASMQLAEGDTPTLAMMTLSINVRIVQNMFIVAVIIGITKLMDVHRDADERERTALALEEAVANAEAEYLRAQTQPAFMFGTLQAIRDRVRSDPASADRMLVMLGELLRRGLDRPRSAGAVTLEEELDFADRYLELQRMRFGGTLAVRVDVEEDLLDARVPPLALQTLIEAVVDEAQPARVEVRGRAADGVLRLEAWASPWFEGQLEQRRTRLQQWFGPANPAVIRIEAEALVAAVALPLQSLEGVAA